MIDVGGEDDLNLFICAKCGVSESDASNLTQTSLFTNAVVGCGHQLYVSRISYTIHLHLSC